MIQIYKRGNNNFDKNGDMYPDAISAVSTVNLNGTWELIVVVPVEPDYVSGITDYATIKTRKKGSADDQLWYIYKTEKTDTEITAYARPVFLQAAEDCVLLDVRPTGKNGQDALDIMCSQNQKYSAKSDITKADTAYYYHKNLIEAIQGEEENSFLNRWGGEVEYNNFQIIVNERVGGNYGMRAEMGYNIFGIQEIVDTQDVITRIFPIGFNGRMLTGNQYIDSENIDKYPFVHTRFIKYEDVAYADDVENEDEKAEAYQTIAEFESELKRRVQAEYESGIDLPNITYVVDFIELSETLEYRDLQELVSVGLGDTVRVKHRGIEIETESRCIAVEYDHAYDRITGITLGSFESSYLDRMNSVMDAAENVLDIKTGTVMANKISGIIDAMKTQLQYQRQIAEQQPVRAIIFEDLVEGSPTYGAMCMGTKGLEIANARTEDGREWKWTTAITADGVIGNTVITGILSDKSGRNFWNLDTGEMRLAGDAYIGDKTVDEIVDDVENSRTFIVLLSNEYQGVPTDAEGNYKDLSGCKTTASAMYGSTDISNNVSFAVTKSAGLSGDWDRSTRTFTVTGLSNDSGYADIKATYLNSLTHTKRFTVVKQKQGLSGTDGKTSYFHVKYSFVEKPTSSSQMTEKPSTYIGTYVDYIQTDSNDPAKYVWARFQGTQGIPGVGTDGKTSYLHIKYSEDGGKTFTGNSGEASGAYIGVYVDFIKNDSMNVSEYTWNLIKGEDGAAGVGGLSVVMGNDSQNIPCNTSGNASAATTIEIPFYGYKGTAQIACTCAVGTLPTGVTLSSNTAATASAAGKIVLAVASGATMGNSATLTGSITLTFTLDSKSVARKFTWTKSKAGAAGASARTYFINASSLVMKKSAENTLAPASVTFSSFYRTGTSATRTAYAGRFKIEESTDGTSYTVKYTSGADESSKVYTPSSTGVVAIKCTLYAAGGTTTALDSQSVTIVSDGKTGATGAPGKDGATGATGVPGKDGISGRTYMLESDADIIKRSKNDMSVPEKITFSAFYRDGNGAARTAYAGRFVIEESTDGKAWVTVYESSANEASTSCFLNGIISTENLYAITTEDGTVLITEQTGEFAQIRCTLYSSGKTSKLDVKTIPVVKDVDALSHEEIFNLLTNNGAAKGIYQEGNQLYINATYLLTGIITDGRGKNYWNLETGEFRLSDAATVGGKTVAAISEDAVNAQTQEDIFNLLTNNGAAKGIYMKNGQLYISFSYGMGGTLKLGGSGNGNGILQVLDASGNIIGKMDASGIDASQGRFTGTITGTAGRIGAWSISGNNMWSNDFELNGDVGTIRAYKSGDHGRFISMYENTMKSFIKSDHVCGFFGEGPYDGHGNSGECCVYVTNPSGSNIAFLGGNGKFYASGSKSRVVKTENYGRRLLYCCETPSPMFEDVGTGITDESGKCYVQFDSIFRETIDPKVAYNVFLQPYNCGTLIVSERKEDYFVVEGEPGVQFAWRVIAKQFDAEGDRLEVLDNNASEEIDYAAEAAEYIEAIKEDYYNYE